jgi:hypothetical protein
LKVNRIHSFVIYSRRNRPLGSGHSLASTAAAAFVPSAAAAQVPEVDPSQPTTQVCLSRSHRLHYPQHQPTIFSFQVAVTLCDGKRERMTLNQSFTGALAASAPALRGACACRLAQTFLLDVKRCI